MSFTYLFESSLREQTIIALPPWPTFAHCRANIFNIDAILRLLIAMLSPAPHPRDRQVERQGDTALVTG